MPTARGNSPDMPSIHTKDLKAFLEERRSLVDPTKHGQDLPPGKGRRAPGLGLTQQHVDDLCSLAPGTYRRLESGTYKNPPDRVLRRVAQLFVLNEQEWVALCRFAGIGDPPGPLTPLSGKEIPGVWQEAVDGMIHPAYVS